MRIIKFFKQQLLLCVSSIFAAHLFFFIPYTKFLILFVSYWICLNGIRIIRILISRENSSIEQIVTVQDRWIKKNVVCNIIICYSSVFSRNKGTDSLIRITWNYSWGQSKPKRVEDQNRVKIQVAFIRAIILRRHLRIIHNYLFLLFSFYWDWHNRRYSSIMSLQWWLTYEWKNHNRIVNLCRVYIKLCNLKSIIHCIERGF